MAVKKSENKPNLQQVSINLDTTPVLYTDNINLNVNPDGVVLDVMQRLGPTNQTRIVSRVGMSRDHAKKFVEKLGKLLLKSEGKLATGKSILN
ncbi:hypothetical protein JXA63_00880 [Candidatus Woesebacteria bacterium]|nr:hypothetical protein [Candidatus Woesebacteria bacterium]